MTIQQSLSRKLYLAKMAGISLWLIFCVSMFLPIETEYFILSLLSFAGFFVIAAYILFFVKCPACHVSIGRQSMSGVGLLKSDIKLKNCPHCDVDFI